MTLPTWSWDDIGYPDDLKVTEICSEVSHPYSGYVATRPDGNRIQKAFHLMWERMPSDRWLNLVEFWRLVKQSSGIFYWEFPLQLYGSPGYGGYGGLEPDDGFDADIDAGFGAGPTFTTLFVGAELPQHFRQGGPGRWHVEATLREFA